MSKHLLIILSGGAAKPLDLIKKAQQFSNRISVILDERHYQLNREQFDIEFEKSTIIDAKIYSEAKSIIKLADQIHQSVALEAVLTLSEPILIYAAKIAEKYKLKFNSVSSIQTCQSKILQRELLKKKQIPSARFFEINSDEDIEKAAKKIGFPGILKPVKGFSSFLVSKVENREELIAHYNEAKNRFHEIEMPFEQVSFVYEEFLVGKDIAPFGCYVSVESLVDNGNVSHLTITDKLGFTEHFVEKGHAVPTSLPVEQTDTIYKYAERIIKAFGVTNGATHIEVMLTNSGPRLIEVNARIGGPMLNLISFSSEYDLLGSLCKIALDQAFEKTVKFNRYCMFNALTYPSDYCHIHYQEGIQSTESDNLKQISFRQRSGSLLDARKPGIQSSRVFGSFYVAAKTIQQCLNKSNHIKNELNISSEPAERFENTHLQVSFDSPESYLSEDITSYFKDHPKKRLILVTAGNGKVVDLPANISVFNANTYNYNALLTSITTLTEQYSVSSVNTNSEGLIEPLKRISQKLNLNFYLQAIADIARDKKEMKKYFIDRNILSAPYLWNCTTTELLGFLKQHGTILAKHRNKSGARDIYKIQSISELHRFLSERAENYSDFIFEKFIVGDVFCVDCIFDGASIAYKHILKYIDPPLDALNTGIAGVTRYRGEWESKIEQLNKDLVLSFKNKALVFHNEYVVDSLTGQVYIIEMAVRPPGGLITYSTQFFQGVNFNREALLMSIEENYKFVSTPDSGKYWGYIGVMKQSGEVVEITNQEIFRDLELSKVIYDYKVGDTIQPIVFSNQVAAKFLFCKQTLLEFEQTIKSIIDRFDYKVIPAALDRKFLNNINW